MKKRGSSQVDWAISLAMFLLYLAWFFILAKPAMNQESDISVLADYVADQIEKNTTWTVSKIPFFVDTNSSDALQPVILDFPFGWENNTYGLSPPKYFIVDESKLYTTYTASGEPFTLQIIHSNSSYTKPFFSKDLESSESNVKISEENFDMNVENGTINDISYRDIKRVKNFSLYVNQVDVNVTNSSYLGSEVVAKYVVTTDDLNQTMLVFTEYPHIFLQYGLASNLEHTITMEFVMDKYPYYFVNTDSWGYFNYSKEECINDSGPFVDVYSSLTGMGIISQKDMDIRMCTTNSSLLVNVSVTASDNFETALVFHTGTYLNVLNFSRPMHVGTGVAEKLNGMNSTLLSKLTSSDYDELKTLFDFPKNTEFSFWVLNSSNDIKYSFVDSNPLETDSVIVREKKSFVLDQDGNLEPYTIRVRVW